MPKKLVVLCIAVFLVFISIAAFAQKVSPNREISERLILQIDFSSWIKESFRVSPDSKHVAYAAEAGNKRFVIVDGKEGTRYDAIGSLIFSPNSKRVAYGAGIGNKRFVIVDGKEGMQYDAIVTFGGARVIFTSFDSLLYLANKGNGIYLVEEKIKVNN